MKKPLLTLALVGLGLSCLGQYSLVINNDAYLVIDGGNVGTPIYVVVDETDGRGITTLGTGGNIISEGEYNKIQWNIGTTVDTYTVPFTSDNGVGDQKIPLSVQTTGGAAGANGRLRLSTWETDDANTLWPDDVTHLTNAVTGIGPNGVNVVDRFWIVDANNYTTKPSATLSFMYNDNNEIGGGNAITGANESDLIAQNFEPLGGGLGLWHGSQSTSGGWYGTWVSARTVNGVNVADADWFSSWTLSLRSQLLPIELVEFSVECVNGYPLIEWTTASETNNDHFVLESSMDGVEFTPITTMPGAGTSSATNSYNYTDYAANGSLIYYRLAQVDFDGTTTYSNVIAVESCTGNLGDITVFSPTGSGQVNINIDAVNNGKYEVKMIDSRGRLIVAPKALSVQEGANSFVLPVGDLSFGVYHVIIENEMERSVEKLVLR